MARTPKLDAVLAEQAESARAALAEIVPTEHIGEHLGASAEGERLVMHRFAASVPGYGGWHWYVTLARGPRMKTPTVCDSGLLPGEGALLAPAWVPWAERVAPEELEAERIAAEAADVTEERGEVPAPEPSEDQVEATLDAPAPGSDEDDAMAQPADSSAIDEDEESSADSEESQPRVLRRRRRVRRASRG